jgi:hypothetical protein
MAKYLGMTLDAKLQWKEHVKKKIEELNVKYRKVGMTSQLSIQNKIPVYSQVMKPVWTYGYSCGVVPVRVTSKGYRNFGTKY